MPADHWVGRLDVTVGMDNPDQAHALRPQLEAMAWRLFPAVLERVFDRLVSADSHLVIDRLDLDLGIVRPAFLETDAAAALEAALEDAIGAAIHRARLADATGGQLVVPGVWRLHRLETFLLTGTLPDRRAAAPFDLDDALMAALADDPAAVVALLRRLGRNSVVLERLVLQLGADGLQRLLAALAPADAATILGLIGETLLIHRVSPAPELHRVAAPALQHLLWVTTLDFLLNDAGSQFNRRRFLEALLVRAAARMGITLAALLALLEAALAVANARAPLRSTLPRTLAELLAEQRGSRNKANAAPMAAGDQAIGDANRMLPAGHSADGPADLLAQRAPDIAGELDQLVAAWRALSPRPEPAGGLALMLRRLAMTLLADQPGHSADIASVWQAISARIVAMQPDVAARLVWNEPGLPEPLRTALAAAAGRTAAGAAALAQARIAHALAAGDHDAALATIAALAATDRAAVLVPTLRAQLAAQLNDAAFARLVRLLGAAQGEPAQGRRRLGRPQRQAARARLLDALLRPDARGTGHAGWDRVVAADQADPWWERDAEAADGRAMTGQPAPEHDDAMVGAPSAPLSAVAAAELAAWLAGGVAPPLAAQLPALAAADPVGIAALLRQAAASADARAVAGRLLEWLLPEEVLMLLAAAGRAEGTGAPILAANVAAAAPQSGSDARWWRVAIAALLTGHPLPAASTAPPLVDHAGRLAALADWLAGGAPPAAAAARLLALSSAERMAILAGTDPEDALTRLRRAAAQLAPAQLDDLLAELAPWAVGGGALAPLLAGRDPAAQRAIRLRAAAAALAGTTVDMAELGSALPPLADAPASEAHGPDGTEPLITDVHAWLDGRTTSFKAEALELQFIRRLEAGDKQLIAWLMDRRGRPRDRERWAAILPVPALARVLHLLAPGAAHALHDGLLLITSAASQMLPFGSVRPEPRALWRMLLDAVAVPARVDVPQVLANLVTVVAGDDPKRATAVRARVLQRAQDSGHARVAAALRRNPPSSPPPEPVPAPALANANPAFNLADQPAAPGRRWYVGNAGLVLLSPFIPTLFERLGLLIADEQGKQRIEPEAGVSRACHLLQYLVDGRLDAPEPELVLNKLLCGLPSAVPVARRLEADAADLALCDDLLGAVIAHWPALSNTSIAGLQETFLQREGRLQRSTDKWTLQVQRRTLDVLMAQLPWGFSIIYHRWMPEPLHVTW